MLARRGQGEVILLLAPSLTCSTAFTCSQRGLTRDAFGRAGHPVAHPGSDVRVPGSAFFNALSRQTRTTSRAHRAGAVAEFGERKGPAQIPP
jgi:hypothetical protein